MSVTRALVILGLIAARVCAQEADVRYRVGGSWLTVNQAGRVNTVDPSGECGSFANGNGTGGAGFGGIDWPLGASVRIGAVLSLRAQSATFVTRQSDVLVRDANWNLVPFVRDYTLAAPLTQIAAVCELSARMWDTPLSLGVGFGPELRIVPHGSRTGDVVSPDNVAFADHARTEDLGTDALPGMRKVGALATVSASYDLPFAGTMHIVPEVRASYSMTAITSTGTWRPLAISFGACISGVLLHAARVEPAVDLQPVVVTTTITTSPGAFSTTDTTDNVTSFRVFEIRDDGVSIAATTLHCQHISAKVTTFTVNEERSRDTTLTLVHPRPIVFALTGSAPRRAADWSITVLSDRDTVFTRAGDGPVPPAILWPARDIAAALTGVEHVLKMSAAYRDTRGNVIRAGEFALPLVADSGFAKEQVQRFEIDTGSLAARWDELIERVAQGAGNAGRVEMFADAAALPRARLFVNALASRSVTAHIAERQRRTFVAGGDLEIDVWGSIPASR